ncbi:hypothetical protein P4910_20255 [Pantoea stewartii]|uniref:hypothetical protein n=1 Tax=Pantoea stewartii TaxID=66269 RepID=UPI0023F6C0B5|nr:hypothetical protein [Pantoea stewartii]MDF7787794.1 hypothetical protein [Pantoea stewartii]
MKNQFSGLLGKELVAAGHQFAKTLDADAPLIEIAKLFSEMASRLDCAIVRGDELQQKLDAMAAENAALKGFGEKLNDMHNILNGEGTGIQGRAEVACQQAALEAAMEEFDTIKTPATEAYLNSVRADAIPEGYVLVPQSINVSADAMESICFHGGDGDGQFGEFTDVILWVGHIENDDGTKTYGLNITTAEYPEEGSTNISEFVEPIGSGTHDTADKAG